jgi:hypothetical protein
LRGRLGNDELFCTPHRHRSLLHTLTSVFQLPSLKTVVVFVEEAVYWLSICEIAVEE